MAPELPLLVKVTVLPVDRIVLLPALAMVQPLPLMASAPPDVMLPLLVTVLPLKPCSVKLPSADIVLLVKLPAQFISMFPPPAAVVCKVPELLNAPVLFPFIVIFLLF